MKKNGSCPELSLNIFHIFWACSIKNICNPNPHTKALLHKFPPPPSPQRMVSKKKLNIRNRHEILPVDLPFFISFYVTILLLIDICDAIHFLLDVTLRYLIHSLFQVALSKLHTFIKTHILEINVSGKYAANMCRIISKVSVRGGPFCLIMLFTKCFWEGYRWRFWLISNHAI